MKANALLAAVVFGLLLTLVVGCQTTPVQQGALMGGALGAGAGAIIGNQSHGRGGEGALIGAGVGALTGALVGDQVDKARREGAASAQPAPAPPPAPAPAPVAAQRGHYENRIVKTASGETYEERVWVPDL
jgi:uncharacterized membrane protein YebE (DUF533 family)